MKYAKDIKDNETTQILRKTCENAKEKVLL